MNTASTPHPPPWPDVAGPIELRLLGENTGDLFTRNVGAVLVFDQPGIIAAWEIVPAGVEATPEVIARTLAALEEIFRPWAFLDPNPIPTLDLFPRLTRLAARLRRARPKPEPATGPTFELVDSPYS